MMFPGLLLAPRSTRCGTSRSVTRLLFSSLGARDESGASPSHSRANEPRRARPADIPAHQQPSRFDSKPNRKPFIPNENNNHHSRSPHQPRRADGEARTRENQASGPQRHNRNNENYYANDRFPSSSRPAFVMSQVAQRPGGYYNNPPNSTSAPSSATTTTTTTEKSSVNTPPTSPPPTTTTWTRYTPTTNSEPPTNRVNDAIVGLAQVRLIDASGSNLGVISFEEAVEKARVANLDLVEVSPLASPPVCRLMNYSKFLAERSQPRASEGVASAHSANRTSATTQSQQQQQQQWRTSDTNDARGPMSRPSHNRSFAEHPPGRSFQSSNEDFRRPPSFASPASRLSSAQRQPIKETKEITCGTKIAKHDLEMKTRKLTEFLGKGHPVKVTLNYKRDILTRVEDRGQVAMALMEQFNAAASPFCDRHVISKQPLGGPSGLSKQFTPKLTNDGGVETRGGDSNDGYYSNNNRERGTTTDDNSRSRERQDDYYSGRGKSAIPSTRAAKLDKVEESTIPEQGDEGEDVPSSTPATDDEDVESDHEKRTKGEVVA